MSQPSPTYEPRMPSQGVVYQVVRDHFETFRAQAASLRDGEGLPRFVEQEFRELLRCGCLAGRLRAKRYGVPRRSLDEARSAKCEVGAEAGGFARFRCDDCGLDRLVPFSCKGRAVCASCGGRRMAERAAHLVDHVFPAVPVRQWVLTFPHRLRYRLAWDHDLCRAVVGVAVRTVLGYLRHVARLTGVVDGRSGAVAIVQRFGGAMNLNVHGHALVIDGVFAQDGADVRFCPAPWLTAADVADVLATIVPRIRRLLERRGLGDGEEGASAADEWAEDVPVLAGMAGASVQGTFALGPRAGQRARPCGAVPVEDQFREDKGPDAGRCHARQEGFDLDAGVWIPAGQRDRLERLCRYALRPTVAQDRLRLTAEGQVVLQLRHPWADGTTHLLFDPLELLERLAVLIPRPRINLILYHGVLGPRAAWRSLVVAFGNTTDCGEASTTDASAAGARIDPGEASATEPEPDPHSGRDPSEAEASTADAPTAGARIDPSEARATEPAPDPPRRREGQPPREGAWLWADLMRRSFGLDVLACPRCDGRFRLIALIEETSVIERILRHLHLPTEIPAPRPGRAPPRLETCVFNQDTDCAVFNAYA